ncbi:hypothetical protein BLA29_011191, partial [Euroglyphus maynei]
MPSSKKKKTSKAPTPVVPTNEITSVPTTPGYAPSIRPPKRQPRPPSRPSVQLAPIGSPTGQRQHPTPLRTQPPPTRPASSRRRGPRRYRQQPKHHTQQRRPIDPRRNRPIAYPSPPVNKHCGFSHAIKPDAGTKSQRTGHVQLQLT